MKEQTQSGTQYTCSAREKNASTVFKITRVETMWKCTIKIKHSDWVGTTFNLCLRDKRAIVYSRFENLSKFSMCEQNHNLSLGGKHREHASHQVLWDPLSMIHACTVYKILFCFFMTSQSTDLVAIHIEASFAAKKHACRLRVSYTFQAWNVECYCQRSGVKNGTQKPRETKSKNARR